MSNTPSRPPSRRGMLRTAGSAVAAAGFAPGLRSAILWSYQENVPDLAGLAGPERVAVMPGKTYLRGWAGYGTPPRSDRRRSEAEPPKREPLPASVKIAWSKLSGPGRVQFADSTALTTTAAFSAPGAYVLQLTADDGKKKASTTVDVKVEAAPPAKPLEPVQPRPYRISSPLWSSRIKGLAVNWIPHCIDQINRTDITVGEGGIDNFIEAGKKLRGEKHGPHKGYVFSNAWVYQTIEAMSIALMIDPQGDAGIQKAHAKMRAALDDWIPKILAAQEPDGYLQTAFTLPRLVRDGKIIETKDFKHWDPRHRGDHEGYVAGYLLEAGLVHYEMTGRKDDRLYNAAKKLADCWDNNLGPAPKKPWYDGHQGMEQALFRLGRFVNEVEGAGKGDKYLKLAKFLLDCRYTTATTPREKQEYDQAHLPVIEQYEAVGHAVRAVYTYSAMSDVVMETGDQDYMSAAQSLWHNITTKKYYVTGGIGSGETSEGFGPDYSLRNRAYCESCSTCGLMFFQWKMNLIHHDGKYFDLFEDALYNALLGSLDDEAKNFYYDNPLDASVARYAWHVCPCCVGNIPRNLLMMPTWMYAKGADGIYVNLFAGSTVQLDNVAGTSVEMVQETDYPWNGKVKITVNPQTRKRFALRIRVPSRDASSLYTNAPALKGVDSLSVNGGAVRPKIEKGYAVISRVWRRGDKVEIDLPLKAQRIKCIDKVEALRGKVALRYGPLIYNIEQADQDISKALKADAQLTTEWRQDFLGGSTVIKGTFADGSSMLAIPNFLRMNRLPATDYPPPPPPPGPDGRRTPRTPVSIVWIKEA